ncbi:MULTISPECIES: HAMP domain-containing sensor histidine kinase [Halobacterium]|uniref:sensor histidine kinase n=1 Tax=Halobacterium TaxID=2239 RepID=UPI0012FC3C15|nr:PAS domain-containing sensor histidine kinase [Halobacterium sp. CBA1132]MCG1002982.1 PAS domain-containing sensor histidine kinase [Halobacterium noricense]
MDDDRLCIGAVLSHDQNRALLTEWLDATYDVLTPATEGVTFEDVAERADLLLLDEGAYDSHAEWVAAYRNREASLFCPVLMLVSSDELRTATDIWSSVDDVVSVPVQKAVLHARIRGLLSRRGLSRELAAKEDRFRTLFETSPDPAIVVDDQGVVVDSNAAFRDLVGASGDCRGRSLSAFDAFDPADVQAMFGSLDGDDADTSAVIPVQTATDRRYVECNGNDLDTEPSHRILILRDVTERIHHEQELQRQVDRLDEFAGVLAHEIRNPLGTASGWLDQAQQTGDSDAFERVETAHERMNEMVEELLQLARQGSVIGERSSVPLARLVADSWATVTTGDATLDVDPALDGRTVTGDPARVQEVFSNLFRNSVEHGSRGPESKDGGAVAVEVGVTENGRGVYVEDDGPGFEGVEREKLFQSGYTTAAHGTGFGLAIVKQIADAHGWTVRATDAESGGARFELGGILDDERDDGPA